MRAGLGGDGPGVAKVPPMLAEIASAAKLAKAAAQGLAALQRLQPEYGKFWKKFEAGIKPEARDLPWDRLKALRLDPEFVGAACGLIRGNHDDRKRMRNRVVEMADPPEGGRYDADEIVERVMRVADESAVAAARDDRDVTAQRGRLLEGRIDEVEQNLSAQLRELQEAMAALQPPPVAKRSRQFRGVPERFDSVAEEKLSHLLDHDPTVQTWTQQPAVSDGGRTYRPDFVVRDGQGVNWFVELKGDHLAADNQAVWTAKLVESAAEKVAEDWRFALVTPTMVDGSASWSDLLSKTTKR